MGTRGAAGECRWRIEERRRQKEERIEALLGKAVGGCFKHRVGREMRELVQADSKQDNGSTYEISYRPMDEALRWKGLIHGGTATPFEGGIFLHDVLLPKEYPFTGPRMQFDTKVWHPCVCPETGVVCQVRQEWSPALTIEKTILTVAGLLSDQGLGFEWQAKVRLWTQQYARPRCGCEVCQKERVEVSEAVAMALHPRLGQHSAFAQLRGAEDLASLIASFATDSSPVTSASCRAWAEKHFLGEWA